MSGVTEVFFYHLERRTLEDVLPTLLLRSVEKGWRAAVQATSIDDTLLTINVQTIAGQQTLSRQAIERSTGVESVVMDDLFRRYATKLDDTLLNQATNGLTNVATATTYTDASPTGPELYPKILGAQSGVDTALMGFGSPDVAVMHTRFHIYGDVDEKERNSVGLRVVHKVDGRWRTVAVQNTDVRAGRRH